MLEFNIRNQEISRIDNFSPAEKSVEYLIAKFNFKTEDWNEAIKRAIFRNVKSKVEMDAMIEDDSCVVPWEVLEGSSDIEVSVHGVIGTEEITTDVAVFDLNRTLQGGSATQEPSPTVYEQMVEMVKDAKEVAQSVRDDADNGKFSGIPGPPGKNGKSAYDYAVEGGFKGTEQEFIDSMGTAGHVDLTGYVTKEQHEAELLKAMVKVTTDPSPFHHITDSANMKVLDFGLEGITEQETTSGKNRIDPNTEQRVSNSVYYHRDEPLLCKAGQAYVYKIYNVPSNITITGIYVYVDGTDKKASFQTDTLTFTFDEDAYAYIRVVFSGSGTDLSFLDDCWCQLETGSVATEYEPFTNGASPNPDYEQPITLAGVYNEETGRYEHKCCVGNKNILDKTTLQNGYIKTDGTVEVVNWIYYTDYVPVKTNTVLNLWNTCASSSMVRIVAVYDKNKNFLRGYRQDEDSVSSRQYNLGDNACYVRFNISTSLLDKYPMATLSQMPTTYTPHASQPFTLTSDRPLTMWDKLVKRDGVYGWSIWSLIDVLNGSEYWAAYNNNTHGFPVFKYEYGYTKAIENNTYSLCSHFQHEVYGRDVGVNGKFDDNRMYGSSLFFVTSVVEKGDIDGWKAWLQSNNITVVSKASSEQAFIPLPDEEQELLNNIETYYGVTNVYNEQGCPMWLKYCADQELHWNQKLLQIQQAII